MMYRIVALVAMLFVSQSDAFTGPSAAMATSPARMEAVTMFGGGSKSKARKAAKKPAKKANRAKQAAAQDDSLFVHTTNMIEKQSGYDCFLSR